MVKNELSMLMLYLINLTQPSPIHARAKNATISLCMNFLLNNTYTPLMLARERPYLSSPFVQISYRNKSQSKYIYIIQICYI